MDPLKQYTCAYQYKTCDKFIYLLVISFIRSNSNAPSNEVKYHVIRNQSFALLDAADKDSFVPYKIINIFLTESE